MFIFSIGNFGETNRLEVESVQDIASCFIDDWFSVRVRVNVPGFVAEIPISIIPQELVYFKAALEPVYRDLKGFAEFKTTEDQLGIKIEVDILGGITARGFLKGDLENSNCLEFTMKFDQTLLWHTISEIDEFLFELEGTKNG